MISEGHPYSGFLYFGLMLVKNEPYIIEYNVRMGDPETQVVLPMLDTSLSDLVNVSLLSLSPFNISLLKLPLFSEKDGTPLVTKEVIKVVIKNFFINFFIHF